MDRLKHNTLYINENTQNKYHLPNINSFSFVVDFGETSTSISENLVKEKAFCGIETISSMGETLLAKFMTNFNS